MSSKPESRRLRPSVSAPSPAAPATGKKTTRSLPVPKTTRRAPATPEEMEERKMAMAAASAEAKSKNQMLLIGGIGGGIFLLVIVIVLAASSSGGGGQRQVQRPKEVAPPPPPKEQPKSYNYVKNSGSIVFVCGGSDKHQDKEVLITTCKKCTNKNLFEHLEGAYTCTQCKTAVPNADIICPDCGKVPRVTHIKKMGVGY